jgi:hypothetical protein
MHTIPRAAHHGVVAELELHTADAAFAWLTGSEVIHWLAVPVTELAAFEFLSHVFLLSRVRWPFNILPRIE